MGSKGKNKSSRKATPKSSSMDSHGQTEPGSTQSRLPTIEATGQDSTSIRESSQIDDVQSNSNRQENKMENPKSNGNIQLSPSSSPSRKYITFSIANRYIFGQIYTVYIKNNSSIIETIKQDKRQSHDLR